MDRLPPDILNQTKQYLLEAMDGIFNDIFQGRLFPTEFEIRVGTSGYLPYNVAVPLKARSPRLGLTTKYAVFVCKARVSCIPLDDGSWGFVLPKEYGIVKKGVVKDLPIVNIWRVADLVLDDKKELTACDLVGSDGDDYLKIADLTPRTRRLIYGGSFDNIQLPAGALAPFLDRDRRQQEIKFLKIASARTTYNFSDTARKYYPKWIKVDSNDPKDRKFIFDNLSDEYLVNNYFAIRDLQKGCIYMYIVVGQFQSLLLIEAVNAKIYYHIIFQTHGEEGLDSNTNLVRQIDKFGQDILDNKVGTITFFYSLEGSTNFSPALMFSGLKEEELFNKLFEEIVDPETMVLATREQDKPSDIDILNSKADKKYWIRQLIRLKFSNSWVFFYMSAHVTMLVDSLSERRSAVIKYFEDEIQKSKDSYKENMQILLNELRKDKNLHLVPRGLLYDEIAKSRVIGSEEGFIYLYYPGPNLVTRIPMFVFYKNYNSSLIIKQIHENTKGMIPFIAIFLVYAAIPLALAAFGPGALVMAFREGVKRLIVQVGINKLTKKLLMEHIEKLLIKTFPRICLTIADLMIKATTRKREPPNIIAFLIGVLDGYTSSTWKNLFKRWTNLATLEPPYVKMTRIVFRIESMLILIDEKITILKEIMNDKISEMLTASFIESATKALEGTVGLAINFFFLDFELVKPVLERYSKMSGEKPITENQWEELRRSNFRGIAKGYTDLLKSTQKDLNSTFSEVEKAIEFLQSANKLAIRALLLKPLVPWVLPAFAAIFKWLIGLLGDSVWIKIGIGVGAGIGAFLILPKDITDIITGNFKNIDSKKAEKLGSLVGQIIGAWTINDEVYGKKKGWREEWVESKSLPKTMAKSFFREQIEVSSILPTLHFLLYNYWQIAEHVIKTTKEVWPKFSKEVHDILHEKEFPEIFVEENHLTIPKILQILMRLNNVLMDWSQKLAEEPLLQEKIEKVITLLETEKPDKPKLPSFNDLITGENLGEWSREAILFLIISQLQYCLLNIKDSMNKVIDPVNPNDPEPISVLGLIELLGFNQGEKNSNETLDRGTNELLKD